MHHFAMHSDSGPVVAYMRPGEGGAFVALQCPTPEIAQREAARMNWHAAADAARMDAWMRKPGQCRRRVRFFPADHSE